MKALCHIQGPHVSVVDFQSEKACTSHDPELTMLFGCDLKAYTELNMSHDRMSVKSPNHTRPSPLSVPSLTKTVLVDVSYFKG